MCGIVGYAGSNPAAPILLQALHDLEYRGYDSAGIALSEAEREGFAITRRAGKIANLEGALGLLPPSTAATGIGHTRWATHGRPTDENAHPHASYGGRCVVVHNGIVENYADLRTELTARGRAFASETDTETVAHLLEEAMDEMPDLFACVRKVAARLDGSQAIVAMCESEPGVIVGARIGNAGGLVVGYCDDGMMLSSDLAAVLPHTRRVAFLGDGEFVRLTADGAMFANAAGSFEPTVSTVPIDPVSALKGLYPHYMLKEIHEQPEAIADTIASLVSVEPPALSLDDLGAATGRLASVNRVLLIGMGTSLHAAMLGKAYFETLARVPAETDNASEFRYRDPVIDEQTLVISVSQSGETVDVLEAMAVARRAGALQVTICNTDGAQTTRVADGTVYIRCGPERGVASTKAFTASAVALYILALRLAEVRGAMDSAQIAAAIRELAHLPTLAAAQVTQSVIAARETAPHFEGVSHMLFLGRGLAYPIAMEGALKMKEVSYIHAEGYAAGEMKHGPIALIDASCPTVAVATENAMRSKIVSNIEQVHARGGEVVAVVTEGDAQVSALASATLAVRPAPALLEPVLATIPLQLLAYEVAVARGCDVDQPRNLAKTVTVE
ncbi:hypothetical protein AYO38_00140 [bacterium SCGC AG-212-C10]|nr:hypothetical protein AYO38_00140 [bacterium SCGC AG-212-C10]